MVTADFMMPASSLNVVPGDPLLRGSIRVWDLQKRKILRTVVVPSGIGTMDVKLIPRDPRGRAFTAGMFDGLVYFKNRLQLDSRFDLDFNTAFATGPARPHGVAMK